MKRFRKVICILCMSVLITHFFDLQAAFSADREVMGQPSSWMYKLDEEVERRVASADGEESLTVGLWIRDIDYSSIEKEALKSAGVGKIEEASGESVQDYIAIKRKLISEEYLKSNRAYCQKYLQGENILFVSTYAPLIITNIDAKSIEELSKQEVIKRVDAYYDLPKSEETSRSIANIKADYDRDTLHLTGKGVKIGVVEMGYPDLTNAQLRDRNIILDIPNDEARSRIHNHSTKVISIIAGKTDGIVPDATVYCAASDTRIGDYEKIEWLLGQGVDVINYSAGFQQNDGLYTDMAKWIDHLTAQLNVVFVKSAGNNGPEKGISDPGMAYNALTVGSMSDNNSRNEPDWTDDYFTADSAYQEYEGCFKPDFTAPGTGIDVAGFMNCSGTSFSAPHVTGVVAQMLQLRPELKRMPCALNALLKSGTKHKTADDYGQYVYSPDYSNKEGAGVIDAKGAYNRVSANQYMEVKRDSNEFPFSKSIQVDDLENSVRVVINWLKQNSLSHGDVKETELADLDLYVYNPDGTIAKSSCSANNNTELVEFMPKTKGIYRIEVTCENSVNAYEVVGLSWNQTAVDTPVTIRPTPTALPVVTTKPTPTPLPVVTSKPTPTPKPVVTSKPTPTPWPVVTPDPTPTPKPVVTETPVSSQYSWNFSASQFTSLDLVTNSVTVDGLSLLANTSKPMKFQNFRVTFRGKTYAYCLSLDGMGCTSYRAVAFHVNRPCRIEVLCKSNGKENRTLGICNRSGTQLGTISAPTSVSCGTFDYWGGADTLYIYSLNSGINLYYLNLYAIN